MEKFELEKNIWTEADYENMGWHDCHIYRIRVTENLELDIDYILQWNKPEVEGLPYTFWIAPATLVFKNIRNLTFEIDTAYTDDIEIQDIELTKSAGKNNWTIITHQGDFEFEAEGFTQYIRQEPFFQFSQTIPFIERNGISLEQTTEQKNPNRLKQEFIENQKKDFEQFENAKKRQLKRIEKTELENLRENNKIDLKEYLVKKKDIKEMLDFYDYWLENTRFKNW